MHRRRKKPIFVPEPDTSCQYELTPPSVIRLGEHVIKLGDRRLLPQVVVFDLDYTVWPYFIDVHRRPPFVDASHDNSALRKVAPQRSHRKHKVQRKDALHYFYGPTKPVKKSDTVKSVESKEQGEEQEDSLPISAIKLTPKRPTKHGDEFPLDQESFHSMVLKQALQSNNQNTSSNSREMSEFRYVAHEVNSNVPIVLDQRGKLMNPYKHMYAVLLALKHAGVRMAIASRTTTGKRAYELLQMWGWAGFFDSYQAYPKIKTEHLQKIKQDTGVPFRNMLFFDDELYNKRDLKQGNLDVMFQLVEHGVTFDAVADGFQQFGLRVRRRAQNRIALSKRLASTEDERKTRQKTKK